MAHLPPSEDIPDDGLETPEVGSWAIEKYRIVGFYNRLFSTGMKDKWDTRVYIDLYAGAGHVKVKGTQRILRGSPLIALNVPYKFDKYIFCEKSPKKLAVLKKRVRDQFPDADVEFIPGDCNAKIPEILNKIPPHSKAKTVLSFCFIDPFNIGIHFDSVRMLSAKLMDFLIILPTGMDATRNQARYFSLRSNHIDRFLGKPDWRDLWAAAERRGKPFSHFLAELYSSQMNDVLGYIKVPLNKMREVKSDDKNLSLYHLAFFSKNPRGDQFWNIVLKASTDQLSFELGE